MEKWRQCVLWTKADLSKEPLSLATLVYYSLFVHAVVVGFVWSGLKSARQLVPLDEILNPTDKLVLGIVWPLVFVVLVVTAAYQMLRVYSRLGATDAEIARYYPALVDTTYQESAYFRWFERYADLFLRAAALLWLLVVIERGCLADAGHLPVIWTGPTFLSIWGGPMVWLYAILLSYTAFVNLPRRLFSSNEVVKSQAGGWAWTDFFLGLAWVIIAWAFPWAETTGAIILALILAIACAFLIWWAIRLELRRPLIEPAFAYLTAYSILKNAGTVLLLVLGLLQIPHF